MTAEGCLTPQLAAPVQRLPSLSLAKAIFSKFSFFMYLTGYRFSHLQIGLAALLDWKVRAVKGVGLSVRARRAADRRQDRLARCTLADEPSMTPDVDRQYANSLSQEVNRVPNTASADSQGHQQPRGSRKALPPV